MQDKHKIPFRLWLHREKNKSYFRVLDNIISKIRPPKKFKGVPKKILLIRNDKIGDAMVTLPVIRDLKIKYPGINIDVLISERNEFIFKNFSYVDELIKFSPVGWDNDKLPKFPYKLFLIGHIIQFIKFYLFPSLFDTEFKNQINKLKKRNYDAVVDFVGTRRNIFLSRRISDYTVGSKVFGLFWLYSYYIDTNWVSNDDKDFMTKKIENAMIGAFGFNFDNGNKSLPLLNYKINQNKKSYKFFVHLGGSVFRKFNLEKEKEIIGALSTEKIIITDAGETHGFKSLKEYFSSNSNIEFKLYSKITDIFEDIPDCEYFICYDGGQAHFFSQYIKSLVIFGSGSMNLWKPYEFEEYEMLKKFENGVVIIKSKGEFGHLAMHRPIWCNPCFDIGCETKPCIESITTEQIIYAVNNYLTKS